MDIRDTTEILELCHKNKELIFITKNGYGELVVKSIKAQAQIKNGIEL